MLISLLTFLLSFHVYANICDVLERAPDQELIQRFDIDELRFYDIEVKGVRVFIKKESNIVKIEMRDMSSSKRSRSSFKNGGQTNIYTSTGTAITVKCYSDNLKSEFITEMIAQDIPVKSIIQKFDPQILPIYNPNNGPCPYVEDPPLGYYKEWTNGFTKHQARTAKFLLSKIKGLPMGTYFEIKLGGRIISARVDWHTYRAGTATNGCFRGISLFKSI